MVLFGSLLASLASRRSRTSMVLCGTCDFDLQLTHSCHVPARACASWRGVLRGLFQNYQSLFAKGADLLSHWRNIPIALIERSMSGYRLFSQQRAGRSRLLV